MRCPTNYSNITSIWNCHEIDSSLNKGCPYRWSVISTVMSVILIFGTVQTSLSLIELSIIEPFIIFEQRYFRIVIVISITTSTKNKKLGRRGNWSVSKNFLWAWVWSYRIPSFMRCMHKFRLIIFIITNDKRFIKI